MIGCYILSAVCIALAIYTFGGGNMTRHELKVILAATGLSNQAPVIEVPSHAIIAAMILKRAIRKYSRRNVCSNSN